VIVGFGHLDDFRNIRRQAYVATERASRERANEQYTAWLHQASTANAMGGSRLAGRVMVTTQGTARFIRCDHPALGHARTRRTSAVPAVAVTRRPLRDTAMADWKTEDPVTVGNCLLSTRRTGN